ncbi:MAG: hypothetical protein HYU86_10065 [Chloroflexi bacterium]|nr:hypothetical protein [Chloroflexota bacterium]
MKRPLCLLVALLLIVTAFPVAVFAGNETPDMAILLTAENTGHADRLVGNGGGAFRFYRIDHPGQGLPVKIELTTSPGRDSYGLAFGLKVYGPTGLVGEAPVERNEGTWTRFSMTLATALAGAYLIQVYNYVDGMAVDFSIQVSGLAEAAPKPDAVVSTADRPFAITQPTANIGGLLLGKSDGNFAYFSFEYPGANTMLDIELRYSPPSPFQNGAIGFNLYRRDDGVLVGQGFETQRDSAQATVSYPLKNVEGGTYLLQVFNYEAGLQANFVLAVSGTAGEVLLATDNTVPEKALVLTASAGAARGSIGPAAGPTFSYFLVRHPGGDKTVTVLLMVDAVTGVFEEEFGFNLYKTAELAGQGLVSLNSRGDKRVGSLSIVEGAETTYLIQVFNYATSAPARFRLYVTGLE